jgi:hypothetical protein
VKDTAGAVLAEGTIPSARQSLDDWILTALRRTQFANFMVIIYPRASLNSMHYQMSANSAGLSG